MNLLEGAPIPSGLPPFPRRARALPPLPLPEGLALRPAGADDLRFLLDLYASVRAPELAHMLWPLDRKQAFVADQFRLQHLHYVRHFPRADFWMIERAGAAIGRLTLDRSGQAWRLIDVALLPEARGGGTGTALLRWLQSAASAAGAKSIALQAAHDNEAAARLYRRLGFADAPSESVTHQNLVWRPA